MEDTATQFFLPDLFKVCPLPLGSTNEHYAIGAAQSRAWIDSFDVFADKKRAQLIHHCNYELLASRAYPYAGEEEFRTCCDFLNLLFAIDDISDEQNGREARRTGETFLKVLQDPSWDDGSKLAQITREFRARFASRATEGCMRRFLENCEGYIEAVCREATLRETDQVLNLQIYTRLRRENSGVRPSFDLIEWALGIDLPDSVFDDPIFMGVYMAAADMVCWANDVYSYCIERSKGVHGNNIVTALMSSRSMSIQDASSYVGNYFDILMQHFMNDRKRTPSWGPKIDAEVQRYVDGLAHWVVANLEWSFETPRYFGEDRAVVKKTLMLNLR